MPHRIWKETKQQPSRLPGPAVPGCSFVSFHFLSAIQCPQTVYGAGMEVLFWCQQKVVYNLMDHPVRDMIFLQNTLSRCLDDELIWNLLPMRMWLGWKCNAHFLWFLIRIMVIDTSHPLETMKRVYRALAKKIWSMIPKEAKGGNIMCYYWDERQVPLIF